MRVKTCLNVGDMRYSVGRLLAAVLMGLFLGVGGCATDAGSDATGYRLAVRQHDTALADFTLAQLQALPQVEIVTPQSQGNQVQTGPTVRSVLGAAGAASTGSVRVEGRDPAQTLTAAELTDQVVLSFTKRGTVKLAGVDLDRARWVRDVTSLVVNP